MQFVHLFIYLFIYLFMYLFILKIDVTGGIVLHIVLCPTVYNQGLSIERVKKLYIDFTDNQKYL